MTGTNLRATEVITIHFERVGTGRRVARLFNRFPSGAAEGDCLSYLAYLHPVWVPHQLGKEIARLDLVHSDPPGAAPYFRFDIQTNSIRGLGRLLTLFAICYFAHLHCEEPITIVFSVPRAYANDFISLGAFYRRVPSIFQERAEMQISSAVYLSCLEELSEIMRAPCREVFDEENQIRRFVRIKTDAEFFRVAV